MKKETIVHFTHDASRDLLGLENKLAHRITNKIEWYSQQEDPLVFAKSLQGYFQGSYRFRIGDYRVIFDYLDSGKINILMVLNINHRKDSYR